MTNPVWDNQTTLRFGFRFVNTNAASSIDPGFGVDEIIITKNCSSTSTITETACDSYTSPSGNYTWTSSNTYLDTIPNAANCDSVITINLTVNSVDSSVTQTGALLTANESGATYQWLDCLGMTPINLATNQSYTATSNGSYSVIITNNGCTDTSACYTVIGVGIVENNFGNELLMFPNPTDGNFFIDLGNNYKTTVITITDLSGRTIHMKRYTDSQLLDLKLKEPAGVYLVIILSEKKKAVIRLIKE